MSSHAFSERTHNHEIRAASSPTSLSRRSSIVNFCSSIRQKKKLSRVFAQATLSGGEGSEPRAARCWMSFADLGLQPRVLRGALRVRPEELRLRLHLADSVITRFRSKSGGNSTVRVVSCEIPIARPLNTLTNAFELSNIAK